MKLMTVHSGLSPNLYLYCIMNFHNKHHKALQDHIVPAPLCCF